MCHNNYAHTALLFVEPYTARLVAWLRKRKARTADAVAAAALEAAHAQHTVGYIRAYSW